MQTTDPRVKPARGLTLFRAMRPHQWVKNLFVLAPVAFAGALLDPNIVSRVVVTLAAFCLAASALYLRNDLADLESDRQHPIKRHRPIAAGLISIVRARVGAWVLAILSALLALYVSPQVLFVISAYTLLTSLYSYRLKRIPYLDVLVIATGFELRILAGAVSAGVSLSNYLVLATFELACFLGFGKRLHEKLQDQSSGRHRSSLQGYDCCILRLLVYLMATTALCTYFIYTLQPETQRLFGTSSVWVTTVLTAYGLWRFIHLLYRFPQAESPTEKMLSDWPFMLNLVIWISIVLYLLYTH